MEKLIEDLVYKVTKVAYYLLSQRFFCLFELMVKTAVCIFTEHPIMQANAEWVKKHMRAIDIVLQEDRIKQKNEMKDALKDLRDEFDQKTQGFVAAAAKSSDDTDASLLAAAKKRGLSELSNGAKAKKSNKVAKKVTPKNSGDYTFKCPLLKQGSFLFLLRVWKSQQDS